MLPYINIFLLCNFQLMDVFILTAIVRQKCYYFLHLLLTWIYSSGIKSMLHHFRNQILNRIITNIAPAGPNSPTYQFLKSNAIYQGTMSRTNKKTTLVFHAMLDGKFTNLMHNSKRTSPGFNFHEGHFTNRDNTRAPIHLIQFKTERQPRILNMIFHLK